MLILFTVIFHIINKLVVLLSFIMNTVAISPKFSRKSIFFIAVVAALGAVAASPSFAQSTLSQDGTGSWKDMLDEANAFSTAIQTMITGFTTVAIAPIGMSAAVKCFRHIALNNM